MLVDESRKRKTPMDRISPRKKHINTFLKEEQQPVEVFDVDFLVINMHLMQFGKKTRN